MRAGFEWRVPRRYNIGTACADSWAERDPARTALIGYAADGALRPISYGEISRDSNRLAAALAARGIARADRIAILLPQSAEAVVAHLACYKLGAIAVPLSPRFGADALRCRLVNSSVSGLITDDAGVTKIAAIADDLPALGVILSVDGASGRAEDLRNAMASATDAFTPVATAPDEPALMIYTSGTTGQPKGALLGHQVLLGHLPGMAFSHEFMPQPGDRLWTPSDWSWAGGLLNCLLPGLALGVPVVFGPHRPFDPDEALALMEGAEVRNAFLPPTALRMIRATGNPRAFPRLNLRTIGSAGESLGSETWEWVKEALGVAVNEFYGQTECNYVLGSCGALRVFKPGAIGRAIPGHDVDVIEPDGNRVRPGVAGEIAIRRPNPAMFLRYWDDDEATAGKFVGQWMLTGDRATVDDEGYVRFVARNDDIIISSGYRVGPSEIEDCLATHPAVAMAAAVGKPDPIRTEIVKAYVKLKPGTQPSPELAEEIRLYVRGRLSVAEYPREIAFVGEIPLTTSGKIIRRHFREIARAEAAEIKA